MLVSFNKNGSTTGNQKSGGGQGAQDYLLGADNDREFSRVLKGEPDITTEIINGLNFAKIYTSGVLAFDYNEGDKLSEQDKLDIIDSFEIALFPNLDVSQYSGYWVEHTDKVLRDADNKLVLDDDNNKQRRLELNFVFANVELESSKALPVYFHRNDVYLMNAWRDVTNAVYDLKDPNSVENKRTLLTVKDLPAKHNTADKRERIHALIVLGIEKNEIKNRTDIVKTMKNLGLEVVRETDKSISIKNDAEGSRNIRFKGEVYERAFTREEFIRTHRDARRSASSKNSIDLQESRDRYSKCSRQRERIMAQRFSSREEPRRQVQKFAGTPRFDEYRATSQQLKKASVFASRVDEHSYNTNVNDVKKLAESERNQHVSDRSNTFDSDPYGFDFVRPTPFDKKLTKAEEPLKKIIDTFKAVKDEEPKQRHNVKSKDEDDIIERSKKLVERQAERFAANEILKSIKNDALQETKAEPKPTPKPAPPTRSFRP